MSIRQTRTCTIINIGNMFHVVSREIKRTRYDSASLEVNDDAGCIGRILTADSTIYEIDRSMKALGCRTTTNYLYSLSIIAYLYR